MEKHKQVLVMQLNTRCNPCGKDRWSVTNSVPKGLSIDMGGRTFIWYAHGKSAYFVYNYIHQLISHFTQGGDGFINNVGGNNSYRQHSNVKQLQYN